MRKNEYKGKEKDKKNDEVRINANNTGHWFLSSLWLLICDCNLFRCSLMVKTQCCKI